MDSNWNEIIWRQYGAAINTLENVIKACPDKLWKDRTGKVEFWYIAYHTIFFLDYYLSNPAEEFTPPPPFNLFELDPSGVTPERVYSKEELLTYLEYCRNKCKSKIDLMTEKQAHEDSGFKRRNLSKAELLLYTMRHVQHHAAQLNLLLRLETDSATEWVSKAK